MILVRGRRQSLDVVRRRIIRETEAALLYGLQFPESAVRIPTVEIGRGIFDSTFAAHFWSRTLGLDEMELAALDPLNAQRSTGCA